MLIVNFWLNFIFVSDFLLEEDDIFDGEWFCNECKVILKEVGECIVNM